VLLQTAVTIFAAIASFSIAATTMPAHTTYYVLYWSTYYILCILCTMYTMYYTYYVLYVLHTTYYVLYWSRVLVDWRLTDTHTVLSYYGRFVNFMAIVLSISSAVSRSALLSVSLVCCQFFRFAVSQSCLLSVDRTVFPQIVTVVSS